MTVTVAVLGGGVAGMSAAHELVERGFHVKVYEKKTVPGGKARSIPVPHTGVNGRPDLPGEHGFRFFPGFYRHVTDTMKRIPLLASAGSVFGNLVDTTRVEMTRMGKRPFIALDRFPRNLEELILFLKNALEAPKELGLTDDDLQFFGERLWQILTSSGKRRWNDYEKLGWWDYVDAANRSKAYQQILAEGMTRSLVAADASVANAKSEGDVGLQLILGMIEPGLPCTDRVLNAPTNEAWLHPWYEYLVKRGVEYHLESTLESLTCENGKITSATVLTSGGQLETVTADYYIVATPAEVFGRLLQKDLDASQKPPVLKNVLAADPTLEGVITLGKRCTAWMNGIQFYLYRDVPVTHGHILLVDSPWSLTAFSQPQFWTHVDMSTFGDGKVRGLISVDISDWHQNGTFVNKPANDCSKEHIAYECWEEMKKSFLDDEGQPLLTDQDLHSWFIDPDIHDYERFQGQSPVPTLEGGENGTKANPEGTERWEDAEPLFISTVNTWCLRPEAYTRIPNLFLASDYVRTFTQLATMEAANEAARRAVNGIIAASGSDAPQCELWKLHEPDLFCPLRWWDGRRYDQGLPWTEETPWLITLVHDAWVLFQKIFGKY